MLAIVSFAPAAASAAMISMLTRTSNEDYATFVRHLLANLKFVWLFAMLLGLGVFAFLPLIVPALFGASYSGVLGAAGAAVTSTVLTCIINVALNGLFSRKRLDIVLMMAVFQVAVFSGVGIVAIRYLGLLGYFCAELAGGLAALCFLYRISRDWRTRNDVSSGPMLCVALVTTGNAIVMMAMTAMNAYVHLIIGAVLAALTLVAAHRMALTPAERQAFAQIVRRFNARLAIRTSRD
jgi:O-antigen/teichoic acid export membrane protein